MKNFKLTFMIAAMLLVATVVNAQTSFGVKAGVNASNVYGENVKNTDAKIGFHAGVTADFHFTPNVAIQTGLLASTKGYSFNGSELKYSANPIYLEVPVHLAYKVDVTPGTRIVFHGGPYVAYGIAGKVSGEDVFDKDGFGMKRFDTGAGFGVGAELGSFILDLGYNIGLVDISERSANKVKNQNAYFSVGYKF